MRIELTKQYVPESPSSVITEPLLLDLIIIYQISFKICNDDVIHDSHITNFLIVRNYDDFTHPN